MLRGGGVNILNVYLPFNLVSTKMPCSCDFEVPGVDGELGDSEVVLDLCEENRRVFFIFSSKSGKCMKILMNTYCE